MGKQEKSFQAYFMEIAEPLNYHRTSLSNGSGFPDTLGFHGTQHSLVELKDLVLGKKGDRLLKQFFEDTQPPWYAKYIKKGGKRLFVAFRIRNYDELHKHYGLLRVTMDIALRLARNKLRYSDLRFEYGYEEYDKCIDMVKAIEHKESL